MRLYRVLKQSQLLKRLGGAWYTLTTDKASLPAPIPNSVRTTLCDLAKKVSPLGPRIEDFLEIPLNTLTWNERVHVIPKQKEWNYEVITSVLIAACTEDSLINIFCTGT